VGEGRLRIEFVQEPHIAAVKINKMPTLEDIRRQLPESGEFVNIYNYLKSKMLPKNDEVARATVIEAQDFILQDGLLYHLYSPRRKKLERAFSFIRQLCITKKFQKDIAIQLHDNNSHIGFDRLYATARSKYY